MSKTNCVNCGSAKDIGQIVCPFCGTAYFDMADVDLDGRTPCILRLKMPGTNNLFLMKAIPYMANITFKPETIDISSFSDVGTYPRYIVSRVDREVTLEFVGVD